eukprot:scaffold3154_cov125-Cyclotella_meneghiniana.AAC.2
MSGRRDNAWTGRCCINNAVSSNDNETARSNLGRRRRRPKENNHRIVAVSWILNTEWYQLDMMSMVLSCKSVISWIWLLVLFTIQFTSGDGAEHSGTFWSMLARLETVW